MKIMHLTWSERHGGAARAAHRLNAALNQTGVRSEMLTAAGYQDEKGFFHSAGSIDKLCTRVSARLDQIPVSRYRDREQALFSVAFAPDRINKLMAAHSADLLHLHWINNGFMRIESIPTLNKPIVWTLHDMWAFTGGCHYSNGCEKFIEACGDCPQLHSNQQNDLSRKTMRRKKAAWNRQAINVVTPSHWLENAASSSAILCESRITTIPNAIDLQSFSPVDKTTARAEFGLPIGKLVLLFGALTSVGEQRKGFHFIKPLLAKLAGNDVRSDIHLAVLGMNAPQEDQNFPFPVTYLGVLDDDKSIARAYSSADVLIVPSMEDNLPNAVMEGSSCGVPSVGFAIGGLPDLIEHRRSGYLAKPFDVDDLAAGVLFLIGEPGVAEQAGKLARQHVAKYYSYEAVARQHIALYSEILAGSPN